MTAILGIDAAWTAKQPSGVALVASHGTGWRLIHAAPSYRHFITYAECSEIPSCEPTGSLPDPSALLNAARVLRDVPISLVGIDMPLARGKITGRRASDNAVSRAYGSRHCSTHSPSALRPGPISEALRDGFGAAGYSLQTDAIALPGLIEVYPHPALVELARAPKRLPYKVSKVRTYWGSHSPLERRILLLAQWTEIVTLLEGEIDGISDAVSPPAVDASLTQLKAYEDMLDAVVCAWVAICAIEGKAIPYGDADSAIWIPFPDVGATGRQSERIAEPSG